MSTDAINKLLIEYDLLKANKNTKKLSNWCPPELLESTAFLPNNTQLAIRIWHIRNTILYIPTCKMCDNTTKYDNDIKTYRSYCSRKCSAMDPDVKNKKQLTTSERYGSDNYFSSDDYKLKSQQTNLSKYGTIFPNQCNDVKEKRKQTNIKRYGVESTLKCQSTIQKIKKTMMNRYGVENILKDPIKRKLMIDKSRESYSKNIVKILEKRLQTNLKRYDRFDPMQQHMSKSNVELSYDKDWLTSQHNFYSLSYISKKLGMTTATLANRFKNLNIEIKYHPISMPHQLLIDHIRSIYDGNIIINDRTVLGKHELDIYCPDKKLAIEVNGVYYHGEANGKKLSNYHINKTLECQKKDIKLIHISDLEITRKQEIVFSRIDHLFGLSTRVNARQLTIKQVSGSDAARFHNENHIAGNSPASHHIALVDNNDIIMIMSIGKPRYSSLYDLELVRMTTLKNHVVRGGISKLLKYCSTIFKSKTLITFADIRWGFGDGYKNSGFTHLYNTLPGYWYIKNNQIFHRSNFQKKLLKNKLEIFDPTLTEWENMINNGWDRVWDCGHSLWLMQL